LAPDPPTTTSVAPPVSRSDLWSFLSGVIGASLACIGIVLVVVQWLVTRDSNALGLGVGLFVAGIVVLSFGTFFGWRSAVRSISLLAGSGVLMWLALRLLIGSSEAASNVTAAALAALIVVAGAAGIGNAGVWLTHAAEQRGFTMFARTNVLASMIMTSTVPLLRDIGCSCSSAPWQFLNGRLSHVLALVVLFWPARVKTK
jgi:hypothetical protein